MRVTRTDWAWVVAFFALSGGAHAGDIYICKGPNGVNSYQNTPCASPAAQLRHSEYDATLARPGTPPPVTEVERGGSVMVPPQVSPPPRQPVQTAQARPIVGFRCTDDYRSWLQVTPCPTSTSRSELVNVRGTLTTTGEPVTGTAFAPRTVPIQQEALDADAFCGLLGTGVRLGRGLSASSESYERNKIKRNLCGG